MVLNITHDDSLAKPVQDEVAFILYQLQIDGESVAQLVRKKILRDIATYVQDNRDSPDDVVRYGLYLEAASIYTLCMQSQRDRNPAAEPLAALTELIDPVKIENGVRECASTPEVQRWLASAQKRNLEEQIEECVRQNRLPDFSGHDRNWVLGDDLIAKQNEHFFSDEQIAAVTELTYEQRQTYYAAVAVAFVEMGVMPKEIETRIARHQVRVSAHQHIGWGFGLRA